jgi:hypothetical protein
MSSGKAGRFLRAAAVVLVVLAVASFAVWMAMRRAEARRRFLAAFNRDWVGYAAWSDGERFRWISFEDLEHERTPATCDWGNPIDQLAWSLDGTALYVIDDTSSLGTTHRISQFVIATGRRTVLADLGALKLEDDDLRPEDVRVIPVGDAEAERERVVFRLSSGDWYSVDSLRHRIRREAGPPSGVDPPAHASAAGLTLDHVEADEDDSLEVETPEGDFTVTDDEVEDDGAIWVRRRDGR